MEIFYLVCMIFCHIVDDFYLQGNLGLYKQKDWWKENYPDRMYKNDYIVALLIHSFSWTFMISIIPIIMSSCFIPVLFICNIIIHMIIDNAKANDKSIDLSLDQLIHIIQIVVTWFVYFIN